MFQIFSCHLISNSDFGQPKISKFTIEKIGTGHPIITDNG